ncbi:hypothetical protein EV356DRAFT_499144 [Viridothelium virens]|uniref:Uncharacterized protein n=1 Tax=Viridothelium virens TaxID=1048519 RepID=A0A6A6HDG8_VIRVR|nr:hypothetical protein EV356DRAFT_499144 [Viridothelium virens]
MSYATHLQAPIKEHQTLSRIFQFAYVCIDEADKQKSHFHKELTGFHMQLSSCEYLDASTYRSPFLILASGTP